MSRRREIILMPVVAAAIYAWMIHAVYVDVKRAVARRWWPAPPIDYP